MCIGGRLRRSTVATVPQPEEEILLLTGVDTSVLIKDFVTEATIRQRFENTSLSAVEATYEFVVQPRHSVCGFRVEIDGKILEGRMLEAGSAKELFSDTIARGYEQQNSLNSVFVASIGNLPAGKAIVVTITYVTELEFEDGKLRFALPMQPFGPRSGSSEKITKFMTPVSEEYLQVVPYGLQVNLEYEMTSTIGTICSSTHPIKVITSATGKRAIVTFVSEGGLPLSRDLVVYANLIQAHELCVRIENYTDDKHAVMIAMYPELNINSDFQSEMIFVVDQSGSMGGQRIACVKDTLQLFLRCMPERLLFNIIGFGGNTRSLFPESRPYDETSLAQAVAFVHKMSADLGGTNILNPLMEIYDTPPKRGVARQIFLFTDGEVKNTQECVDLVLVNAACARMFTFGIGNAASRALVCGMAEAGQGSSEFIEVGANMQELVIRQLVRALKPALTALSISWGDHGCTMQTAPYRPATLFAGQCLIVYALLNGKPKDLAVCVSAHGPDGPWSATVPLSTVNVTRGNTVAKLAARRLLRDLQEKRSFMHDDFLDVWAAKFSEADVKREMIAMSIQSGVACECTAFLVQELRTEATVGSLKLIPLGPRTTSLTAARPSTSSAAASSERALGEAQRGGTIMGPDGSILRVAEVWRSKTGKHGTTKVMLLAIDPVTGKKFEQIYRQQDVPHMIDSPYAPAPDAAKSVREDTEQLQALSAIINHANANGSFPFATLKAPMPHFSVDHLRAALPTGVSGAEAELILCTALVCITLATQYLSRKTRWELVAQKAERWIKRASADLGASQVDWKGIAMTLAKPP